MAAKKSSSSSNSASNIYVKLQQLSNQATETTQKYNQAEANTARSWQESMSNTAHQREVADLKKAGLNPVLASNQGAQSYTTSAASAQAENAANAVANAYGANVSAEATRAAAAQSAAATRAAAAQTAAAQRYAAAMSYQASVYHSDRAFEASKYKSDKDYKIAMDKPQTNPFGIVDKYLGKELTKSAQQKAVSYAKKLDSSAFVVNRNMNNFTLSKGGIRTVNNGLTALGLKDHSKANQNLFVKAFYYGSGSAASTLKLKVQQANKAAVKQANSAASVYTTRYQPWDSPRWK